MSDLQILKLNFGPWCRVSLCSWLWSVRMSSLSTSYPFLIRGADTRPSPSHPLTSRSTSFSVCPSIRQWRCIPALFSLSFLLSFILFAFVSFLPLILFFLFGGTEPSSGRSSPLSSRPATPTLSLTPKHFHIPGRSWSHPFKSASYGWFLCFLYF